MDAEQRSDPPGEEATPGALTVDDLFDAVVRHDLHFDQTRQTGVVLHMLSSLTEEGRIGLTSVGDTPQDADRRYREAQRVLLAEAAAAAVPLDGQPSGSSGP